MNELPVEGGRRDRVNGVLLNVVKICLRLPDIHNHISIEQNESDILEVLMESEPFLSYDEAMYYITTAKRELGIRKEIEEFNLF
jgi:hypothetical protein